MRSFHIDLDWKDEGIERMRYRWTLPLQNLCLGVLLMLTSIIPVAAQPRPKVKLSTLQDSHSKFHQAYHQQLNDLADRCHEKQLKDGVAEIQKYLMTPTGAMIQMVALSPEFQPDLPADLTPDQRQWRVELRNLREDYAKKMYLLSRQAVNNGHPGFAFDLVREIVSHDPDHVRARELLGFVDHEHRWVTPQAKALLRKGFVWSEQFGWISGKDLPRYLKDERLVDGRWVSREKEAEIRRDFQKAWEIRTDHYLIRTNHSLERGVELGLALEDFHEFFHQTFAAFFTSTEQLQQLFQGASKPGGRVADPYSIHFYRDREEYVTRLEKHFRAIDKTNGIYLPSGPVNRTAHFYHDPMGHHEATLYHEATHQLFYESHSQNRAIADKGHFWVVEGVACYMESFQRRNGELSVGDPKYIRFAGARYNFIEQKYYVPLQQLSQMGMQRFQADTMLAKNYTQASGLVHFFMHYDGGRYRDALVTHLNQLYSGIPRTREFPQELDALTDETYSELDRLYGEYVFDVARKLANSAPVESKTPAAPQVTDPFAP